MVERMELPKKVGKKIGEIAKEAWDVARDNPGLVTVVIGSLILLDESIKNNKEKKTNKRP